MARAAWELGRRLVDVGLLADQDDVRLLHARGAEAAVQRRAPFVAPSPPGSSPPGRPLPTRFRLDDDGRAWAAPPRRSRRRRAPDGPTASAPAAARRPVPSTSPRGVEVPAGSVLVVGHLDPRLATVIPRLAGLVAETGSPLSHLAILAREHGVATVVGLADATTRFRAGDVVTVDGHRGPSPRSPRSPRPTVGHTSGVAA